MNKTSKILGIESYYFISILILYTIAHGGVLLIPNAIFWDDWVIFNVNPPSILRIWQMAGSILNVEGYSHIAMLNVGPWLYKVLTFSLIFLSGIALWKVLEKQRWLDIDSRFLITLFFLLLPLNSARVAMINFRYTLCCFTFFTAWYFLGKNRLIAAFLFFFSFTTNSLLVFYTIPITEWYFRDKDKINLREIFSWFLRRLEFLILPFAFWFIKTHYFKPFGLYQNYNEVYNLKNLIAVPIWMIEDFLKLQINVASLFLFLALTFWLMKTPDFAKKTHQRNLFLIGLIVTAVGLFPYLIVGAIPTFQDWTSRHQLLMPLGLALLLVALINRLNPQSARGMFVFLIAFCLALNCNNYVDFFGDWSKQRQLVSLFSASPEIRDSDFLVIDDRTENALKRIYRFYEWNGLIKLAFKSETHFAVSPEELLSYTSGEYDRFVGESYNNQNHVRSPNKKPVIVKINYALKPLSIHERLKWFINGKNNFTLSLDASEQQLIPEK